MAVTLLRDVSSSLDSGWQDGSVFKELGLRFIDEDVLEGINLFDRKI